MTPVRLLEWAGLDAGARAQVLARPSIAVSASTRDGVARILESVGARGDDALREFGERYDGLRLENLEVDDVEFAAAKRAVSADVHAAIVEAAGRIEGFHAAGMAAAYAVETAPGVLCERIQRPIRRVGLYVPAGTAPLPSTALMLTIPAWLAGCPEIVLCTPPRGDGSADPTVLVASRLVAKARVFKLGGAQAIAAMALGTATVPRCDKLFGPGNSWVDEAKRQAAAMPGGPSIDMPAGPSELMVIADAGADPVLVAADLLSQAEHGPDSQVLLLSDSMALLQATAVALESQLACLPRASIAREALAQSRLVRVAGIAEAIAIGNEYAPEHLILALREPRAWLPQVESAGSVFLGDWTPEALGDYCSGSNHVLPTGGAARGCSGLSVASFQKALTVQTATSAGIRATGHCAAALARVEGLLGHARAVELRMERAG